MKLGFLILTICVSLGSFAQRTKASVGTWQFHTPQHEAHSVAKAGDKVYCATETGLFYYSIDDNSTTSLTKQDGLSDIQISTVRYYQPLDMLVIGYKNTNIDIIQGDNIFNINDIFRKQIVGEKTINHIMFDNDFAYFSCSFGVVVLDLNKLEVKESYTTIGDTTNGLELEAFASVVYNDSLFVATENGVRAGSLLGSNLLDFNSWSNFPILPADKYTLLNTFKGNLYVFNSNDSSTYSYDGNAWNLTNGISKNARSFFSNSTHFYVLMSDSVLKTDFTTDEITTNPLLASGRELEENNNELWIADGIKGLLHVSNGLFESIYPAGPVNRQIFSLSYSNGNMFSMRGGYQSSYARTSQALIVDVLLDWGWTAKGYWQSSTLNGITDIVDAVQNPANGKTYLASHGYGLLIEDKSGQYTVFNDTNSPMVSILPSQEGFMRVTGLAMQDNGDVWITTHGAAKGNPALHVINSSNTFIKSFEFSQISNSNSMENPIIAQNGYIWVVQSKLGGGGVMVFDEADGPENARLLISGFEDGGLPDRRVNDIAEDLDGEIWVATEGGVAVFATPETIFEGGEANDAFTPIFEGRPLLESENVSCIAVDGGNRKWMGTGNGVWLFEDEGTEVVLNFTTDNSPLPSDKINDIAIHQETGEVFIATDLGLVSYRGTATESVNKCETINVFPNPVQPGYEGNVGITGVTTDAEVRITDISGNLMFKTDAQGGMVSWDLKDYLGTRASSGVYTVLVNKTSKKNSCVVKVVVIN